MYGIIDGGSGEVNILLRGKDDRQACYRALAAAQLNGAKTTVNYEKLLAIERLDVPSMIEADLSEDALRGLADIALGNYGQRGFSGLSQDVADEMITSLSGDTEYFFYPILTDAERN
jgi:hypothetical protein